MDLKFLARQARAKIQTKTSPKLDPIDVVKLIVQFTPWIGEQVILATAICGAESGYRLRGWNAAKNGSDDYGLFQINTIHGISAEDLYDPVLNVQAAYRVWAEREKRGQDGWSAWVAYKNNKHVEFMGMAREAHDEYMRSIS